MNQRPTALIAEDEPLLAAALQAELKRAWPELDVVATAGDGEAAVELSLRLLPDVLFFDIQMPGMTGLDAAFALADAWPANKPFAALVFVTAFDQFAVQAFEAQAVDYLLKPVQSARLVKTADKLRAQLAARNAAPVPETDTATNATTALAMEATWAQLRALAQALPLPVATSTAFAGTSNPPNQTGPLTQPPGYLSVIAASVGNTVHMVPVHEVVWFEAADKYIRVLTAQREYLIRTPLKELLAQLDLQQFWQVHRGSVVQASQIEQVNRDEAGKLWLQLRSRPEKIAVSRLWAHLFKAM